jgi:hypothetical protein
VSIGFHFECLDDASPKGHAVDHAIVHLSSALDIIQQRWRSPALIAAVHLDDGRAKLLVGRVCRGQLADEKVRLHLLDVAAPEHCARFRFSDATNVASGCVQSPTTGTLW